MTSLAFSSNGKFLLVGTAGNVHYVLDAFDGTLLIRLEGFTGLEGGKTGREGGMVPTRGISGEEVCWTPDSKFVVGGSLDGKVHIWDLSDERKIPQMRPLDEAVALQPALTLDGLSSATRCIKFNPRYHMMSTAGAELVRHVMKEQRFISANISCQTFWLPDNNNGDNEGRIDKGKAPEV